MQAVREGHVHIGEIGLPPFIKAFSKGLPARNVTNWEMDARVDMPGLLNCLEIQETLGADTPGMQPADMVSQL